MQPNNSLITRIYWIAINGENLMIDLHVFMWEHSIPYSKDKNIKLADS
jgi:hypothetical protein